MLKKFLQTFKISLTCVALGNLHIMKPLHAMQCDNYDFVSKSFSVRPGPVNATTCEVDLQPSSTFAHPVFTAFAGAIMGACLNTYGPKAWKKFKEALYFCLGKYKWDHTKEVQSYIPLSLRNKGAFETYVSEVDKFLTSNGFQRNVIAYTNSGRFGCLTDEEVFLV